MPRNLRVQIKNKSSTQMLTEQESFAFETYLSNRYGGHVDLMRRIILSRTSGELRESIRQKSGDVFTLKGDDLHLAPKGGEAYPLERIPDSRLFIIRKTEDGGVIYLDLVRITDYEPVGAEV